MLAADSGEHGGDMAVARVERFAELAITPADPDSRRSTSQRWARRSARRRAARKSPTVCGSGGSCEKPWRRSQEAKCRQSAS